MFRCMKGCFYVHHSRYYVGDPFGVGTIGLWQQACSLYDASIFCYQKSQRLALAEGVMAYACALYKVDAALRNTVFTFKRHTIFCHPEFYDSGVVAEIVYELSSQQEVAITVFVRIGKNEEILRWKCPVQDQIFTIY